MNTAQRLEQMTDRGKFERLANAVLRKAEPVCAAVIAFGINAQGETIRGPLDGFGRVPGGQGIHFVTIQHTTTDRSGLRNKWLSDRDDNLGDLLKIGREAAQLRKDFPSARFTAFLSANQRLPSEQLFADVQKRAEELGVSVHVWEQSRYADFLDAHRDGQYLRKEFLGTCAEMLSEGLLRDICNQSLSSYGRRQYTAPDTWVARELDDRLRAEAGRSQDRALFVVGDPGSGKSAAAYRLLEDHLVAGGYGLHIPETIALDSISLEDALRETLDRLYPALLSREVKRVPEFAAKSGLPFIVVVDDINRISNPAKVIRDLVAWVAEPFVLPCPVWPRFWGEGQYLGQGSAEAIRTDRMLLDEARRAVQAVTRPVEGELSNIEAYDVAQNLACDPWLIGTFGDVLSRQKTGDLAELATDTVVQAVKDRIKEVERDPRTRYFEHEYSISLRTLASSILEHRKLRPTLAEVEAWLCDQPKLVDALRELCSTGSLCSVVDGVFQFQHDRFLVHFCVEALEGFLDAPELHRNVLTDPYYADWVAQALIRTHCGDDVLGLLTREAPLVLASAMQFVRYPVSDYHQQIVDRVKYWVSSYAGPHERSTPESLRAAVLSSLLRSDSPVVLDLPDTSFGLDKYWLGGFIRFRNGDAAGALTFCGVYGLSVLNWGQNRSLFLELVDHARLRHRSKIVQTLTEALEAPLANSNERHFKGAPVLAGFLGLPELSRSIQKWWATATDKTRALPSAIWAALRCSTDPLNDGYLDSLMAYWAQLPEVAEDKRLDQQEIIAERLSGILPGSADHAVVQYLVEQSRKHPSLRPHIGRLCGLMDSADAVEFAVEVCAEEDSKSRPSKACSVTWWGRGSHRKLSSESTEGLRSLWTDAGTNDEVRELAFRVWRDNVARDESQLLPDLTEVSSDDTLFRSAVGFRAELGDDSCLEDLLLLLGTDTSLFWTAHDFWCDEMASAASHHLQSFKTSIPTDCTGGRLDEHYSLALFLKYIPPQSAERLLSENWGHLRYSRLFVQAALFIGTPHCLAMAGAAIADCPDDVDPFEHIDQYFGFFGYGAGLFPETSEPPVDMQRLHSLELYVDRLDDLALDSLAEVCYLSGEAGKAWAKVHLPQSIDERCRRRYLPTEEELIEDIEAWSRQMNGYRTWLEAFEKRGDERDPVPIMEESLRVDPCLRKYRFLADCVELIGTREDLKLLDIPFEHAAERVPADRIKESVAFAVRRRTLQ